MFVIGPFPVEGIIIVHILCSSDCRVQAPSRVKRGTKQTLDTRPSNFAYNTIPTLLNVRSKHIIMKHQGMASEQ